MKARLLLFTCFLLTASFAGGQAKMRKLPNNLNHPAINNYSPFISLDGNSMVYVADLGEDHELTLAYTTRQGVNWKDAVMLPKVVNNRLNFLRGFGLSPDGKTLYISNQRSNGMGGFDLYASRLIGANWEEPVNMLLPANSKSNEACPSVSLDGSAFYYMRCEKMDANHAEECRILVMKKKPNGQWDNPVELPAYINTGNSQTPRIMGDNETLIFSSDRLQPGKGGMDLYFTRFVKGEWSRPQPLDFVNTSGDDQFASATSAGMYLVKDNPGQRSSELVEFLFPPEVRPKGTLRLEGQLSGPPDLSAAYITVYNLDEEAKVFVTQPSKDGSFLAYLTYGHRYEISVEPALDHYTFFSRTFDLHGESNAQVEKVSVVLTPTTSDAVLDLEGIQFEPRSTNLRSTSKQELGRLVRLMRSNPDKSFAIEVTLFGYLEDSVRSTPDLTEVTYDTTRIPVTYQVDSVTTGTRDSLVIRARYHNDRTLGQARALSNALVREGIPAGKLACSGNAIAEALPEKRRTEVQIIVH